MTSAPSSASMTAASGPAMYCPKSITRTPSKAPTAGQFILWLLMTELRGQVAWITGSSRGLGRAIADHLASLGANVVVHGTTPTSTRAFSEADSLEAVAGEIAATHHVQVLSVHGDLSRPAAVDQMVREIHDRFEHIDILVHAAGGDIGAAEIGRASCRE